MHLSKTKKDKKTKPLMGIQQNLIYCDGDTKAILKFLCEQSNSLYNCGIYWARQIFFKTGKIISKFDPVYEVGNNIHAQAMPSVPAQQTLLSVSEVFKSFKGLRELFLTEEANTSCASYLDGYSLPKHGEKPIGWKASGKRILRGLYRSKDGSLISADLQAAGNILRKVAGNLGIDLSRLGRCCLTSTSRIRLWATKSNPTLKNPRAFTPGS